MASQITDSEKSRNILQGSSALAEAWTGRAADVRSASVRVSNRLHAHTMAIRDANKKAHWKKSGSTSYQFHLLFDKHNVQAAITDTIAERVQTLGGITFALAQDFAKESSIAKASRRREPVLAQLTRIPAYETILIEVRSLARIGTESDDDGTNNLIIRQVARNNDLHSYFNGEQLTSQIHGLA
jgi:starvation-inducible DNA-binding protein